MRSALRGPTSFAKYQASARPVEPLDGSDKNAPQPGGFPNVTAIIADVIDLGWNGEGAISDDRAVTNRSIWMKMLDYKQVETAIENIIKLYDSGFISEWEYK